jgi:hypothetical protein
MARLCIRFARSNHPRDAVRLARLLASRAPDHDDLARALLAATETSHRHGDHESAANLARELHERRPDSAEARIAAGMVTSTALNVSGVRGEPPHGG